MRREKTTQYHYAAYLCDQTVKRSKEKKRTETLFLVVVNGEKEEVQEM